VIARFVTVPEGEAATAADSAATIVKAFMMGINWVFGKVSVVMMQKARWLNKTHSGFSQATVVNGEHAGVTC
jgi:hypothetical protein